ncbi:MAG: hypothetical protein LBG10_08215 [Treponema sp.]|jgi:hypothetical protein|nr:hypothetical protein [Treponema sp.]
MNKVLLLLTTFITLVNLVEAQEAKQIALGVGVEGNMNTRQDAALGSTVSAGYGIFPNLAAGIKFGFSHNMARIMTLEPEVFVRWYIWELKYFSFFAQAGVGTSVIFEDKESHPAVLGNLAAGLRIPLKQWYAEPYLRTGYPFIWGAGMSAGYRF